jgi:hypothetical protein
MAKPRITWIAWGAAVALAYAALGIFAYVIGPATSSQSVHSCGISGTGSGRTTKGDSSAFRLLVFTSPPGGAVFFTDQGPTSPLMLHDRSISSVTCSPSAEAGTVTGAFALGGGSSDNVGFRIDFGMRKGTSGQPTFRIRLTNGYDSGNERLTSADLDIQGHTVRVQGAARG